MLSEISILDHFKDFHFNFPHPQSSQTGILLLAKEYRGEGFCKAIVFKLTRDKSDIKI